MNTKGKARTRDILGVGSEKVPIAYYILDMRR